MKYPTLTYLGRAGDFSPVRSMVTISGDSEVLIENCRRIIECSDIRCCMMSAGYMIEIWGSGLSAASFAGGSASVTGRVQSVTIERRRDGAE